MNTNKLYHYVYRITNIVENKHYYGKRSSNVEPLLDLGVKYFSSSSDKSFIRDQKQNPNNYRYKIVFTFKSSKKALALEIKLHSKFNVGVNPLFYNKVKQTSLGFDHTGTSLSEDHKKAISISNKGKNAGINNGMYGKTHSSTYKNWLKINNSGVFHPQSKLANIYNAATGEVIAVGVCIRKWAAEHGISQGNLSATARADFSLPSSRTNRCSANGYYARYVS